MRLTTSVLVTALCISVVSSNPLPEGEGLQSKTLDRLVMVEGENDATLRSKRTIGILKQLFPELSQDVNPESENKISEPVGADNHQEEAIAESQNNEVRVQFADETQAAASDPEPELAPLEDIEVSDDENRNKRFLNFGGGANGAAGGGSGAGSGNFLFDIIRLVAGSGSGSSSGNGHPGGDPAAGAPSPGGGQEAVPGPVTRLFVIANRGISNLIQDLILRLAATSERIVNFKARLITSII